MNELADYNISITLQDAATFFGAHPPDDNLDLGLPGLITELPLKEPPSNASESEQYNYGRVYKLLKLMRSAVNPAKGDETVVADFTAFLLDAAGYDPPPRILQFWRKFKFTVRNEEDEVIPDLCIVNLEQEDAVLLVVDRHRRRDSPEEAKARLISKAIATSQFNYDIRKVHNLPPPKNQFMPGILMKGATPTFFKIPVTLELASAVRLGEYPSNPTTVFEYSPHTLDGKEWLETKENRVHYLRSFQAFKQFVE